MSELQEAAVSQNCAVCRSPHTVVVVEESADVSADWPATLCEPCWDDIRAVWGDYTTIDEKATQTLEARNDDRQEQLVTDGGQEEAATAQELVERWRDLAGMAALHERDTFNARCEIYAKCADELEEVFLRD